MTRGEEEVKESKTLTHAQLRRLLEIEVSQAQVDKAKEELKNKGGAATEEEIASAMKAADDSGRSDSLSNDELSKMAR